MTLPNFLIVGAAKSGTTSLHYYLQQHPDVFMSSEHKEINFYAFEGQRVTFPGPGDYDLCTTVTDVQTYESCFESVIDETAIGESAPIYLYSDRAASNIKRFAPDTKLIAILRDPVDRAFSSYLHMRSSGREHLTSFEEGLRAEESRVMQGWEFVWHYKRLGFYADQVERYLNLFDRRQMRFYLYDDFRSDPTSLLQDLYKFIGVAPEFKASTSIKYNATGLPRNEFLGTFLQKPNLFKSLVKPLVPRKAWLDLGQLARQYLYYKPSLNADTREALMSEYRNDILRLQELIDRDLSAWR